MHHRVLEVEVMDTPEEAVDYDAMDATKRMMTNKFFQAGLRIQGAFR